MGRLPESRGILSTLAALLKQSGKEKSLSTGHFAHNHVCSIGYDSSRFLANWVIQMYGECGCLEDAQAVFDSLHSLNIHSWSILLTMYAQNGHLQDAKAVFERIPERTVVPWNAMMTACIQNGRSKDVSGLFCMMMCEGIQFDNVSFVSVVDACSMLEEGKRLHVLIAESGCMQDLNVGTTLLTMYGRFGCVKNASSVFKAIVNRDQSCWNAMMAVFSQNEHGKEAMDLFLQMQLKGFQPDIVTFVCVLDGCASLSALTEGLLIHAIILEMEIEVDHTLGTAFVDMYGKCGSVRDAYHMFLRTPHDKLVSWNAIISIFAQNGHAAEAVFLFSQMQVDCVEPDYATFISVLTACSHAGLVNLGWYHFSSMYIDHGIEHKIDHYACMIDLLGRAGHLDEAELLLNRIPLKVDDVTWRSLLAACKIHFDVDRATEVADRFLALEPEDAAPYVALLNIHAVAESVRRHTHV